MEKARSIIIGETLAGAATIAITILTIAFFTGWQVCKLRWPRHGRSHWAYVWKPLHPHPSNQAAQALFDFAQAAVAHVVDKSPYRDLFRNPGMGMQFL
jgi:hypothetical protein